MAPICTSLYQYTEPYIHIYLHKYNNIYTYIFIHNIYRFTLLAYERHHLPQQPKLDPDRWSHMDLSTISGGKLWVVSVPLVHDGVNSFQESFLGDVCVFSPGDLKMCVFF